MEAKCEFAEFMASLAQGGEVRSVADEKEITKMCLRNRRELSRYETPGSPWSLFGLWFSLTIRWAKERPRLRWRPSPSLRVCAKQDEELTDDEFAETLYLTCAKAVEWKDPPSFREALELLKRRAPEDDSDVADKFGALEVQLAVSEELSRALSLRPWAPTPGYSRWLEEILKENMVNLVPLVEAMCLRPGERERMSRQNMDVEIDDPRAVVERNRGPNSVSFPERDPLQAPPGTVPRNAAVLGAADSWFRSHGFSWWEKSVLLAEDYFADREKAAPGEPVVMQHLGRFDVLFQGALYPTENAEAALYNWCLMSTAAKEIVNKEKAKWDESF